TSPEEFALPSGGRSAVIMGPEGSMNVCAARIVRLVTTSCRMATSPTRSVCITLLTIARRSPPHHLARIKTIPLRNAEPNEQERQGPERILKRIRASVEGNLGQDRLGTWVAWGLDTEALCRGLQGGCLPNMAGLTEVRQDSDALLSLLYSVKAEALSR